MAVHPRITSTLVMFLLLCSALLATTLQGVQGEVDVKGPSESQCRPYIEKALKKLETGDTPADVQESTEESIANLGTAEKNNFDSDVQTGDATETVDADTLQNDEEKEKVTSVEFEEKIDSRESLQVESKESVETESEVLVEEETKDFIEGEGNVTEQQLAEEQKTEEDFTETEETLKTTSEEVNEPEEISTSAEAAESVEKTEGSEEIATESVEVDSETKPSENTTENKDASLEKSSEESDTNAEKDVSVADEETVEKESSTEISGEAGSEASLEVTEDVTAEAGSEEKTAEQVSSTESSAEKDISAEKDDSSENIATTENADSVEEGSVENTNPSQEETKESEEMEKLEESTDASKPSEQEEVDEPANDDESMNKSDEETEPEVTETDDQSSEQISNQPAPEESFEQVDEVLTEATEPNAEEADDAPAETVEEGEKVEDEIVADVEGSEAIEAGETIEGGEAIETVEEGEAVEEVETDAEKDSVPEEDLMQEFDIPDDLRPRHHISQLLHLDDESTGTETAINKAADGILRELKRLYENAIKPLEILYKYRDLSNRHFGDPEIFSKPLVLFMGPWSGGKSSIINYLLDNEYKQSSLRTGAEPSPAYFNILMWGEKPEVLDGTQLAADWTFSGLQKFGQGLEDRLRGLKLPSKLLEKINIVEIPGILEVRKQVSRMFPFNDACQWFIDRADIIFLVYDPSKLDVGPETEAILDQLKGREYQTRIVLNKADQVKPEELMRVQGALIWNISPLMSSAQPPVMYLTSLWSRPYEMGAPVRLLQAQERAFLRDLRTAVDKRIENKISSARRFAVRVRNHAKMVDCYLTTYYNHKSVFGNKKLVSEQIIEHPQDYHIYEGLSTLTNISRYDLPDPDVYRDFFHLNPLYDFQQLSATCTYFRGCPINRLDVAIAYDLPELVGKYKKVVDVALVDTKESTTKS